MLSHYLMIGLGGAIGSISRVALGTFFPLSISGIPMQILCINILGCFIIGALAEVMAFYWAASDHMRYLLIPGFLGGFTTFSSFALEFGLLVEKNQYLAAFFYVILSVCVSLISFFAGMRLVKLLSTVVG